MQNSMSSIITSVVVLAVMFQQLADAVADHKKMQRQQREEPCGGLNGQWIDTVWSAYKEKFDRSYSPEEDLVRCVELR